MDSDSEYYFVDYTDIDGKEGKKNEFSDSSTSSSEVIDKNKNEEQDVMEYYLNMANQVQTNEDYLHEVLNAGEVVKHMNDCIREVNAVLQLPSTFTRVLLNHFKWDKDRLAERFYDGDEEKLFSDVKILLPFRSQITSANEPSTNSSKSEVKKPANECEICFLPVSANEMIGVQCGHTFCASCWNIYLTTKIMDEGSVEIISCAAYGCNSLVDDETVMKFVKNPSDKLKYQQLIAKGFVDTNRLLNWCMAPNCSYVIKVQNFDAKPVTCKCSKVFCFACGENCHDPIQCKWLQSWLKKCKDDSETLNWIAVNTKKCPKCHQLFEKNGGCNHMRCNICKFEFCWLCMESWTEHTYNNCNKFMYDEEEFIAQANSNAALDRYLFYHNRYSNQMKSLKLEHQLHLGVGMKMKEMQQNNMLKTEVKFLKKAVDVLCQCRQTLMYTYVFAFYLQRNNESIIFEDNQKDLEIATEQLSGYLEHDLTLRTFADMKEIVKHKYNYCESRRKVLLDHVYEGYHKNLWLNQDSSE